MTIRVVCQMHPKSKCVWNGRAWQCLDGGHLAVSSQPLPIP